jgi:Mrp family chromosome partitioning ATPase
MLKNYYFTDANEHCPGVQSDNAGKSDACDGCPNQQICASGEARKEDPTIEQVRQKLSGVKNVILVMSGKGGVGKSTVATQLAMTMASLDQSTENQADIGLLDVDICGPSVPRMLGLEGSDVHKSNTGWSPVYVEDNFAVMSIGFLLPNKDDPVIWRGPRKDGLIKQFLTDVEWNNLDYLFIDTPPGTSDEHISIVNYLAKTNLMGAVIVTTPQEVALLDVRKEVNFCKKTGMNVIGVVENMSQFVCPHCKCQSDIFPPITGGATKMCADMGVQLLAQVPLDPDLLRACESGKCFATERPQSQVAVEFTKIAQAIRSKK